MKKSFYILITGILLLSACGTTAQYASSSASRFEDGIYYNPRTAVASSHSGKELAEQSADDAQQTDELIAKTKSSEIYLLGNEPKTVIIPESQNTTVKFTNNLGATVTLQDNTPDFTIYFDLNPWGYYRPYSYYGSYWDPWYYNRYRYDPWYYDSWYWRSSWYYGGFNWWYNDPWIYGGFYAPWYRPYYGWYGHPIHHHHPPHHPGHHPGNKPGQGPGFDRPGGGVYYGHRSSTTGQNSRPQSGTVYGSRTNPATKNIDRPVRTEDNRTTAVNSVHRRTASSVTGNRPVSTRQPSANVPTANPNSSRVSVPRTGNYRKPTSAANSSYNRSAGTSSSYSRSSSSSSRPSYSRDNSSSSSSNYSRSSGSNYSRSSSSYSSGSSSRSSGSYSSGGSSPRSSSSSGSVHRR